MSSPNLEIGYRTRRQFVGNSHYVRITKELYDILGDQEYYLTIRKRNGNIHMKLRHAPPRINGPRGGRG